MGRSPGKPSVTPRQWTLPWLRPQTARPSSRRAEPGQGGAPLLPQGPGPAPTWGPTAQDLNRQTALCRCPRWQEWQGPSKCSAEEAQAASRVGKGSRVSAEQLGHGSAIPLPFCPRDILLGGGGGAGARTPATDSKFLHCPEETREERHSATRQPVSPPHGARGFSQGRSGDTTRASCKKDSPAGVGAGQGTGRDSTAAGRGTESAAGRRHRRSGEGRGPGPHLEVGGAQPSQGGQRGWAGNK